MTTINPLQDEVQSPVSKPKREIAASYIWGLLRIGLGWVFLWAFLDKMFGWSFSTESGDAWINGGSPTSGFLAHGTSGPFESVFQDMSGSTFADVLFMVGLGAIGAALILGIGMRIAAASGALLMLLMWSATLPPETNPFMSYHLLYAGLLIGLALVAAEDKLGLGKVWGQVPLVQRLPWLK